MKLACLKLIYADLTMKEHFTGKIQKYIKRFLHLKALQEIPVLDSHQMPMTFCNQQYCFYGGQM
jgi:hypothetical protein